MDLGPWRPLYLFCTWTPAFSRISPIERFSLFRLFENLQQRADRLPPPPIPITCLQELAYARALSPRVPVASQKRRVGGNPPLSSSTNQRGFCLGESRKVPAHDVQSSSPLCSRGLTTEIVSTKRACREANCASRPGGGMVCRPARVGDERCCPPISKRRQRRLWVVGQFDLSAERQHWKRE